MNGSPVNVLLVEDNEDHAELVMRSLAEHGVANDVRHVIDGEQALDYLFRRDAYADPGTSPRPHVILLDLRLPKVGGLEVLAQVKRSEDLRRIPVVVLTTSEAESDVTGAYDAHVNAYLVKPVDFDRFARMMHDLGFFWLAWNQAPRLSNGP